MQPVRSVISLLAVSLVMCALPATAEIDTDFNAKLGDWEPAATRLVTIASYNVQNLFDTEHDPGKDDWEFLPKNAAGKAEVCAKLPTNLVRRCLDSDWTEDKLALKIGQIKKIIDALPLRPSILGLVEVENENVVRRLATALGYQKFVMTDSSDARGIDVAVLFNESTDIRFITRKFHAPDFASIGGKPSRDILEAQFAVGPRGETISVLMNHWPSQSAKVRVRTLAAEKVAEVSRALVADGRHVIAMGDFNVEAAGDVPSPFAVFGDPAKDPLLTDVHPLFLEYARAAGVNLSTIPAGTYFYGNPGYADSPPAMAWNLLDRFFVSSGLLAKTSGRVKVDRSSYRIFTMPEMVGSYAYKSGVFQGTVVNGVPKRYDHGASTVATIGFSDHFPILMNLVW